MLKISNSIYENSIQYDDKCLNFNEECIISFNITDQDPISGPINVYYELSNFYQNHRVYYKSRDSDQLKGTYKN